MYEQVLKLEEVEEALNKLDGKENRVHVLVTPDNKNYEAKLIRIDEQPEVLSEMHEVASDVYMITSGSCKLTLGGTLIEKKDIGNGDWLGQGIENGEVHEVKKGDTVSIPPNTPHMIDIDGGAVSYIVLKVFNKTIGS